MIKRSSKYYLLQGLVILIIALICLIGYAATQAFTKNNNINNGLEYVSYEILTDNIMPASKQETEKDVIRPYEDDSVKIGKSFYDYQAEEQNQEASIIYYEDTYIQNQGVDYISGELFQINSIADGTVISVTEDDIVGKTIKIKHNNEMISIYQSVNNVSVKEKDVVTKGQVIATSGTNNIGSDLGNHLHFELYNNNILVNPEDIFINTEGN